MVSAVALAITISNGSSNSLTFGDSIRNLKTGLNCVLFLADLYGLSQLFFADDTKDADVTEIKKRIKEIRAVSGEHEKMLIWLEDQINERITVKEFEYHLAKVIDKITELEATTARHELEIEKNRSLIFRNSQGVEENRKFLQYLQSKHDELRREFDIAINELEIEVNKTQLELKNETYNRIQEDQKLSRDIEGVSRRVSELEYLITPETRYKTASVLASNGALMLINSGDSLEASRFLRLSIAYDKIDNRHFDPASRYWLAIAYRRLGKLERAEEVLAEAIAAERFREMPKWHRVVIERFQGPDRFWIENARREPRFGVKAPRDIVSLELSK
ncbi:MAG TPA: hypothetical protein DIW81_18980 [Planctomycetaceae bacterium]|nr:hypothetical protein [Rubinisphaera sp.]HCS53645.1 hypothetical protein [Planctomycetaceae bacterium]|tara:strand:+ start:11985 stop:12983 length:999 start_codon:yes stop_codon:yes gene_type:complete